MMGAIDAVTADGRRVFLPVRADDIAFAREISGHSIPHWSLAWPRIGELQRRGLVRVNVINRWIAGVKAIGPAAAVPVQ